MEKVKEFWQDYWQIILAVLVLSFMTLFFLLNQVKGQDQEEESFASLVEGKEEMGDELDQEDLEEVAEEEPGWIMVDIKGHVKYPGVYEVLADSRIQDVVELAGGLSPEANPLTFNLAQKVRDEMVIYIGGPDDPEVTSQAFETSEEGESLVVNLNEASKEELMQLNSIGPAKADNIIQYREDHGGFKTIEELKNVSGIGDKTFENLKDNLSI
ncbi:ComE operon protein 1 [Alloiococcus otitis]|uniref:ComEA protein n=1 Tax=Alloiococcus otitis ATCC 51267 TaxID=883081 RepID=K9EAB2_9LACT|nr:helix-hairpin-helix domain-containing protein [Alloiococcus otitis]EKU94174.1 comEA protein [Alloiococcus otitis ATCC 51267]SUU81193.1 ComE operon protein 1 [Alloiococcus otitis]